MKTRMHTLTAHTISILSVIVLIGSACGGTSGDDAAADPVTSPTTSTPDPAVVEAWVISVSDAWSQLDEDIFLLRSEDFTAEIQADDTIVPLVNLTRGEADLYEAFADTLEQAPSGSGFEGAAATLVAELRGAVSSLRQLADGAAADPDLQGSLIEGVGEGLVEDRRESLHDDVRLACFPFQDAVAAVDASFPLIDCANSDQPIEFDIQPRGTGDLPTGFDAATEAGTYRLGEFARPFAIEFPLPISISLSASTSDLVPIGDWAEPAYYAFWIVAPDELPVPGTPYGPIDETVPFPDDLSSWLIDSGLDIVAEGTTQLADGPAPYWTVEVPDWTIETAGGGLVFATAGNNPDAQIYPIRHNSTIWQLPHPEGPLVVIAPEKWEIPGHPDIDEITDFVEAIVSTVVPIDRVEAPAPTAPPNESNDDPFPTTDTDVATLRESILNLDGRNFDTFEDFGGNVAIVCDQPQFELVIPIVAGLAASSGIGNIELLEFGSTADRDAFFAAVEEGRSVCEAMFEGIFERERIDADPGRLLVESVTAEFPEGSDSFVSHVTTVGATGVLTINAPELGAVNELLAELGIG